MTVDVSTAEKIPYPKEGGDIGYIDMIDEDALGESQIRKMFAGATVFLTGGTGFLGKLIIEKLLRCCPEIKKMYIMARPKKSKSTAERIQEQFEDVLYSNLRKERPDFFQQIDVVEGDVGYLDMGISEQDRIRLVNEVEFIFHGAATVRLDEPLKKAVKINVRGTREMLQLARECGKLKSFVYISTAYSNCVRKEIDEKFYDVLIPGDTLIDLVETVDENIVKDITPRLIGKYPNTYTFTKSIAENITTEYSKGLPVAVFRPSIVIATAKEPLIGWIDNFYGPIGVVVSAGLGLLRTLCGDVKAIADLVPADMTINACIACAWKTARDLAKVKDATPLKSRSRPMVYNYVSSKQNPLTWENYMNYLMDYLQHFPSINTIYYYVFLMTSSRFLYNLYSFFLHWIPAYIVDGIAIIMGKKPMLRKAYTKIAKFSEVITFFCLNQWKFHNKNVQCLFDEMCDADKQIFDFDMSGLKWDDYCYNLLPGLRVYLQKDPINTLAEAKIKLQRLKYLHYILCTVVSLIAFKLLWSILTFLYSFIN